MSDVASVSCILESEADTLKLGAQLAPLFLKGLARVGERALCIRLEGDLGAGKTTMTRGLLQALKYEGIVKSPTYTLVESYHVPLHDEHKALLQEDAVELYHFDLYRLMDPEELEMMGIRDYFAQKALCMIEWPDRGEGVLPESDITIELRYRPEGRDLMVTSPFFTQDELASLC